MFAHALLLYSHQKTSQQIHWMVGNCIFCCLVFKSSWWFHLATTQISLLCSIYLQCWLNLAIISQLYSWFRSDSIGHFNLGLASVVLCWLLCKSSSMWLKNIFTFLSYYQRNIIAIVYYCEAYMHALLIYVIRNWKLMDIGGPRAFQTAGPKRFRLPSP